jgi:hypothetical protein
MPSRGIRTERPFKVAVFAKPLRATKFGFSAMSSPV